MFDVNNGFGSSCVLYLLVVVWFKRYVRVDNLFVLL